MGESVTHLAVSVDIKNVQPGVHQLMRSLRPEWPEDQVKIKIFTDGITNVLVGAHIGDYENMILVRVYGENTDLFIDRDVEKKTMQFLHSKGCAKPLYCTFENGICYGFVTGQVFDDVMMRDRNYAALVAKEMARLHTLDVPESYAPGQTRSSYFIQFDRLLQLLPDKFDDPAKEKRYREEVMTKEELRAAAAELEKIGAESTNSLVLCHHDLLIKNLVYNSKEERVYFIDYEYAGISYPALDIGDHFAEYAGVDDLDFSFYPSRDAQLAFIRVYLTELARYRPGFSYTEHDVHTWYTNVNKMALMAHLFWGVWGIIQSYNSSIDFDFLELFEMVGSCKLS